MKGVIRTPRTYHDGQPACEIDIHFESEEEHELFHAGKEIKLKIGQLIYTATIRQTDIAGTWIASYLYDFHRDCERLRLSEVLSKVGLKRNDKIQILYISDEIFEIC